MSSCFFFYVINNSIFFSFFKNEADYCIDSWWPSQSALCPSFKLSVKGSNQGMTGRVAAQGSASTNDWILSGAGLWLPSFVLCHHNQIPGCAHGDCHLSLCWAGWMKLSLFSGHLLQSQHCSMDARQV